MVDNTNAPFVWGDGGAHLTPEQITAQRKIAAALMKQGMDYSPVQSPWQGAARVAQALLGGYEDREADDASKANQTADGKALQTALAVAGYGDPAAAPANAASTAVSPAAGLAPSAPAASGPAPVAMAPSVSGKIYSNDEASPLDPPDGQARDMAIRTVYGEDPGQSALGVANVIRNRAINGGFGGDTIPGVVLAKNQFEPWNNAAARARMESLDPNSPTYQRLGQVVDEAYSPGGDDPTNGATMFYSPTAQAALGRNVPAWAQGPSQDIGEHRFYGGANPAQVAQAGAGPAPVVPVDNGETTMPANATATVGSLPPQFGGPDRQLADPVPLGPGVPAVQLAPADQAAASQPVQTAQASPQAATAPAAPNVAAQGAPAAAATPAAATAAPGMGGGVSPSVKAKIAPLLAIQASPYISDGTKKIAGALMTNLMAQDKPTTADLGDRIAILRGGQVTGYIPKSTAPTSVGEGGTLVGREGNVVYQAPPKQTDIERNYNFYSNQEQAAGRTPQPFTDWLRGNKAAGANNVVTNVDNGATQTYDKLLTEGMAKSHAALSNGVEDAQARARDIAAMQGALDSIQKNGGTTGGMAPDQILSLQKTINAGASALGMGSPFDEAKISDKEFLQKFNQQLAGAQAKNSVGSRVTNFEMSNYLKSNPGLGLSVTGNQRLLGIQAQIEQRNIAVGTAIRDATAQAVSQGKKIDPVTVQKLINGYDDEHHITDPISGQDLTQSYALPEFQKGGANPNLAAGHKANIDKLQGQRNKTATGQTWSVVPQ